MSENEIKAGVGSPTTGGGTTSGRTGVQEAGYQSTTVRSVPFGPGNVPNQINSEGSCDPLAASGSKKVTGMNNHPNTLHTPNPSVSVAAQDVPTSSHHRLPGGNDSASNAQQSSRMQNNAREINQNNNNDRNNKPANGRNRNKTNTTRTFFKLKPHQ